ncbi:MAG TPA: hypothetical protein VFB22_10330 [Candidatus Baltobacteraceae bacterium]|nr:hypothetical protein [Candidatus Baltobacteraceae bacterium]
MHGIVHPSPVRALAAASAVLACVSWAPASAKGVALVQQSNGSVKTYAGVDLRFTRQTLRILTRDGAGTLVVSAGACSFSGALERCLPYAATLRQHGTTSPIPIAHGALFFNLTDSAQRLPRSSQELAPRTTLAVLRTVHGTYVTVKGTLDEVSR